MLFSKRGEGKKGGESDEQKKKTKKKKKEKKSKKHHRKSFFRIEPKLKSRNPRNIIGLILNRFEKCVNSLEDNNVQFFQLHLRVFIRCVFFFFFFFYLCSLKSTVDGLFGNALTHPPYTYQDSSTCPRASLNISLFFALIPLSLSLSLFIYTSLPN